MMTGQTGFDARAEPLTDPEQVGAFLRAHPTCAIFKAGGCRRTDDALAEVRKALDAREDIPAAIVRVIAARAASNEVAALTGVRHQSPQLLLLKDGQVVFARDNWELSAPAIAEALALHFPEAAGAQKLG
jgi:bacillithiol system protein YtxJ